MPRPSFRLVPMGSRRMAALLARTGPFGAAIAHLTGVGAVIADLVDDRDPGSFRRRVVNASHVVVAPTADVAESLLRRRWFVNDTRLEVDGRDPAGRDARAAERARARASLVDRARFAARRVVRRPEDPRAASPAAMPRAPSPPGRPTSGAALTVALLSPAVGTNNLGDHFIERAIRSLLAGASFERFGVRTRAADLGRALQGFDHAVVCGTNLYQFEWPAALHVEDLDGVSTPVVPFGVGGSTRRLDEIEVGALTTAMIRRFHSGCAVGSVRDPHALEVVRHAGVGNVVLTGCPVLFAGGHDTLPAPPTSAARRIVIAARAGVLHVPAAERARNSHDRLLRRAVARYAGELPIVLVAHEEDDLPIAEALGVPAVDVVGPTEVDAAAELYSDPANVVLALRLHAGMFAISHGVHAVLVGHDSRTFAFGEMLGVETFDQFSEGVDDRVLDSLAGAVIGERPLATDSFDRYEALRSTMQDFLVQNGLRQ